MQKKPPQLSTTAAADRTVWPWLALVLTTVLVFSDKALSDESGRSVPVTLVELFTSQGCSSCPPADSFLKDLSARPDVLALSFHVDYWDTETWQDPFSSPSFGVRQRHYQDALATDYIYTPQMVVHGGFAAPGGRKADILNAIEATKNDEALPVLTLERDGANSVAVAASSSDSVKSGDLYIAVFNANTVTRVRGGENRGRTLTNVNVVRRLIRVAAYNGEEAAFQFSLNDLDAQRTDGIAVFVQADAYGPVVSAIALRPLAQAETRVSLNTARDTARP